MRTSSTLRGRARRTDPKGSLEDDGHVVISPPCSFKRNVLGICDLGGNVSEWCSDGFDRFRYRTHETASVHKAHTVADTSQKVIRGGKFARGMWGTRVSRREGWSAAFGDPTIGFRVVLDP